MAAGETYEQFVDKFKPKKTTDDCMTPPLVYDAVRDWAVREYGLDGARIVRPFWPGADYKTADYSGDCVVIDNPPFSILAEIARIDRKAAQVLSAIGQLTDERQKLILTMRYIEGAEWPEIVEHFQRQEDRQSRWVFIQHGRALGIIRRWMEENGVQ